MGNSGSRSNNIQYIQQDFECKSPDQCESIRKTLDILKYYQTLNLNETNNNTLIEFVNKETNIIDHYIHIVTKHNNDMEDIYNLIIKQYTFQNCNVDNCILSTRHNRDRQLDEINENDNKYNEENVNDSQFIVWRDILDSMHCHLFHLYDFGYRIHKNELNEMKTTITKDTEDTEDITCDDNAFKLLYSSIKTKLKALKCTTNTPRHQSNKFNLNLFNNTNGNNVYSQSTKNVTFMDRVYDYLNQTCMQQSEVNKLKTFLEEEQYDTDSIMMDAKNGKHSNLKSESFNLIKDFVYQSIVTKGSFAIGFIFYYWGKKKKQIINWHKKGVEEDNINDHSGFKPSELF
eukprot:152734_1